jgi:hypothetical protein
VRARAGRVCTTLRSFRADQAIKAGAALEQARRLTIVSGGQTGVDRAALDWALANGVGCGGWCPQGGWAEDFPDPPGLLGPYPILKQTPSREPDQRTEWNVRDSAVTVLVASLSPGVSSTGTELTKAAAERLRKPVVAIDVDDPQESRRLADWLASLHADSSVNVAGPRESESPGIYRKTLVLLNSLPLHLFAARTSKRYLWSDAWIFQAIVIASHAAPARLSEILAAADGVNHALPTDDELHGAFARLTEDRLIVEVGDTFQLTGRVPREVIAAIVGKGWRAGRSAAERFLDAEQWTPQTNLRDPRNTVVYPPLTSARIQQADRDYRRRIKR